MYNKYDWQVTFLSFEEVSYITQKVGGMLQNSILGSRRPKASISASYPQVHILVLGTTLGSNPAGQKTASGRGLVYPTFLPSSFSNTPVAWACVLFNDCEESLRCAAFGLVAIPVHVFSGCPNSPWTKIMLNGIQS